MKKLFGKAAFLLIAAVVFTSSLFAQEMFLGVRLDTVKAQKFDTGRMWTFEDAPVEYFELTYNFKPTQEWLDDVQQSALKFASWCSSSFVSEDGLVMTNHHCVDFVTDRIAEEGEDLHKNGFYAESLSKERKIPGVFVDQMVLKVDVTDKILNAMKDAKNDEEKLKLRDEKIKELKGSYGEDTGLVIKIVPLYNGGKYSLYGYKRYKDVRAVYINETSMGLFGGDPDNFTYPRYNADFAFVRVYDDNGQPLKTDHFFKWSKEGPKEGEPLFVVGNPGRTQRLKTVAQLEYYRDFTYRNQSFLLSGMYDMYQEMINEFPDDSEEYKKMIFYIGNSAKAIKGIYEGLLNPILIARKKDFEKKFKEAVFADKDMKAKYGHLWEGIENTTNEMRQFGHQLAAYEINARSASKYFVIAKELVELAAQLQMPDSLKDDKYKGEMLESTIGGIYPEEMNLALEQKKMLLQMKFIKMNLGEDDPVVKDLLGGKCCKTASKELIENSVIADRDDVMELINDGPEAILSSDDPIIRFVIQTKDKLEEYKKRRKEILDTQKSLELELGQALYAVYGTSIPPDATFTLRISDGVMKKYKYNGTEAPMHTTFYGLYNRYYSHDKKFPWDIPERWLHPKEGFDMSAPLNFISTNDIIGGNSGSPVINKNAEIVGIAFDGNIESLSGDFIFSTEANRTVSVASTGIIEILRYIGNAERIAEELEQGKIPEEFWEELPTEKENEDK
ncbi:MAG: S46 family peptidase [Chlorobi bacterium]|nr:S46 family peptidase [Chlorobiota bacterium]